MYYNNNSSNPGAGVVGGIDAMPHQYPWQVRLYTPANIEETSFYTCGGSIISETFILTAAHCVDGDTFKTYVYFGKHQWNDWNGDWFRQEVALSGITVHPNYVFPDYDYALVELPTPLNFSESWKVQKICLPESCSDGCAPGTLAYISGWGKLDYHLGTANILQSAFVEIQSNSVCDDAYGSSTITDRVICAGPLEGGVGTCQGDSGGPMMTVEDGYFKLCGVTSFGPSGACAAPNALCMFKLCQLIINL